MRGPRFDRLMSSAALVLLLTIAIRHDALANTQTPAVIESAVPMPEATTVAPPTASDVAPSATQGIGTATPSEATPPAETAAPAAPSAAPAETATVTPAEAAPPPDPLASLDPADRPLAEKLRDLLPKSERIFTSRRERQAVEAFYQKRNYQPVWFERGAVSARSNAAVTRIHASS